MNLRELSKTLGLSQTTVSRALNGYPEVNDRTRKRVIEAARAHNYRPNLGAKSLATGRSMSVGHVIPLSTQNEMVNVVFSDFIAGAGEVYGKNGYDMRLSVVADDQETQAYRAWAETGAVDGVVVHAPLENDPRIGMLSELGLPFLVHGRSSGVDLPYAWLDVNNIDAIAEATSTLVELGHRRIALVNGREVLDFALCRRKGYETALTEAGLPLDPDLMFQADMSESHGHLSAQKALALADPPTAFVASSVLIAFGIKRAVEEHGLRLGEDVSLICFDDEISYLTQGAETPLFSSMRSSVRAAGRRCAELLIAQIQAPAAMPRDLPGELWQARRVMGHSTGPGPYFKTSDGQSA